MRGVSFLRTTLVGGVGLCISCSLAADLNGVSGGAAPRDDASSDASSEQTPPASLPEEDAGALPDARSTPCASTHTFCDDFDDGAEPAMRWSGLTTAAGPIDLDTTVFLSPSRSLRARQTPGEGLRRSYLEKTFAPAASHVTFELDVVDIQRDSSPPRVMLKFDDEFTTIDLPSWPIESFNLMLGLTWSDNVKFASTANFDNVTYDQK